MYVHVCIHISAVKVNDAVYFLMSLPVASIANGNSMYPVVECVVVAHWAQDGSLKKEHASKLHSNFFTAENRRGLYKELIEVFVQTLHTIISLMENKDFDE